MCVHRVHFGERSLAELLQLAARQEEQAGATLCPRSNGAHRESAASAAAADSRGGGNGAAAPANADGGVERRLVELYAGEEHLLVWDGASSEAWVLLRDGAEAQPRAVLRALWQACWLHRHQRAEQRGGLALLEASLAALRCEGEAARGFASFEAEARALGWDVGTVQMDVGEVRFALQQQDV